MIDDDVNRYVSKESSVDTPTALAREGEYAKLVQRKNWATTEDEYLNLFNQFKALGDYKDSVKLTNYCDERWRYKKKQREEQEQNEEQLRIEHNRKVERLRIERERQKEQERINLERIVEQERIAHERLEVERIASAEKEEKVKKGWRIIGRVAACIFIVIPLFILSNWSLEYSDRLLFGRFAGEYWIVSGGFFFFLFLTTAGGGKWISIGLLCLGLASNFLIFFREFYPRLHRLPIEDQTWALTGFIAYAACVALSYFLLMLSQKKAEVMQPNSTSLSSQNRSLDDTYVQRVIINTATQAATQTATSSSASSRNRSRDNAYVQRMIDSDPELSRMLDDITNQTATSSSTSSRNQSRDDAYVQRMIDSDPELERMLDNITNWK